METQIPFNKVLITGTTSGLGRAFLGHFTENGATVICVNRRRDESLETEFPKGRFEVVDITNPTAVTHLLRNLVQEVGAPDLFILNAGINRPDNVDVLNYSTFREVFTINTDGVLTWISAIGELELKGRTIAAVSSTSNIVPNPGHLGYFMSKWALKASFEIFAKQDRANTYKTVVLGPVHTGIMAGTPPLQGLQKKIFDFLAVGSKEAARACARFFESSKSVLNYPLRAFWFYLAIQLILKVFPQIYQGTRKPTPTLNLNPANPA